VGRTSTGLDECVIAGKLIDVNRGWARIGTIIAVPSRVTGKPPGGGSDTTLLDVAMLDDIPLFSDLDKAELALLSGKAVTRHYPRNTIILNEGDHSDSLYIIRSGSVKVFLAMPTAGK
jgi:hypothetical protein